MLQSNLPNFVKKEFPKDEESYNARILMRAGFVDKVMAGVYSYLPLGLKVLRNIERVVRNHMDKLGHEIFMPVLHPKEPWQITGRWDELDVLFKVISRQKREYALGPTHEEVVVPLAQKALYSYRDLPFALYQIQTKFRDEPRAKSGLLRGREFLMKDLYSFHATQQDLKVFYEKAKKAYLALFADLGLEVRVVEASGGTFSQYSHEFQVLTESGEDTIVLCESCDFAQNNEINDAKEGDACPSCGAGLVHKKGSEVGNIFELNTKYSDPFNLSFTDEDGVAQPAYMGCYGIGISRLMGIMAEMFHDEKGLLWPAQVAPYQVHLLALFGGNEEEQDVIAQRATAVYDALIAQGIEVLYDDRVDMSPGEKFAESDLIGLPIRLVVSAKTGEKVEYKLRTSADMELLDASEVVARVSM